jgi:hypothetical protein
MSFLFKALQGDRALLAQTGPETVDKLVDRIIHATLLEDRRAAVLGLKGLARDWTLEVGTRGMSALVSVLQNDTQDSDIIVAAIETLTILCTRKKTAEVSCASCVYVCVLLLLLLLLRESSIGLHCIARTYALLA